MVPHCCLYYASIQQNSFPLLVEKKSLYILPITANSTGGGHPNITSNPRETNKVEKLVELWLLKSMILVELWLLKSMILVELWLLKSMILVELWLLKSMILVELWLLKSMILVELWLLKSMILVELWLLQLRFLLNYEC
jgi:hypothetical protein